MQRVKTHLILAIALVAAAALAPAGQAAASASKAGEEYIPFVTDFPPNTYRPAVDADATSGTTAIEWALVVGGIAVVAALLALAASRLALVRRARPLTAE